MAVLILILIPKLDRNSILREGEELLAQLVVRLPLPLRSQEGNDFGGAFDERRAIAPDAIGCISQCDFLWFPAIPLVKRNNYVIWF